MSEKPDDIIREYIDFVNKQVRVYMDVMSGFAGNRVLIERQVQESARLLGFDMMNVVTKLLCE